MQAGRLDTLITIEQKSYARTEFNELVDEWEYFAQVWASVNDISGREFLASGGIQTEVTTKIYLRQIAGVTAGMRVVDGSDIYNIIAPLGRDRRSNLMTLMCSRGLNNG